MNKDQVIAVEFRDNKVFIRLADGREIGNPLEWHSWLSLATPAQRAHVERHELSVYFPDLDDGLDVQEMLKGMPPRVAHKESSAA